MILLPIAVGPAQAEPGGEEARRIVKELEADKSQFYFDMHGNPSREIERLELLRFDATAAIQDGIDRLEGKAGRGQLVLALYATLGFVKDPASIPWLEARLRTSRRASVESIYLPSWQGDIGAWPWLTGRDRWIEFFISAFRNDADLDRRIEFLAALTSFDDDAVLAFFKDRRPLAQDPREILLVEVYLYRHGYAADAVRISVAIAKLRKNASNRDLLLRAAGELRHEAFVPYLIDTLKVAEKGIHPASFASQDLLERITYRDIQGKREWKTWYVENRGETRAQWVAAAISDAKVTLAGDPNAAKEWFEWAKYRWNDMVALEFIRDELLPRRELRSEIAGWINLTHSQWNHEKLRPIAEVLVKQPDDLEDWAKRLLMDRGYIHRPGPEPTWTEYVSLMGSAV